MKVEKPTLIQLYGYTLVRLQPIARDFILCSTSVDAGLYAYTLVCLYAYTTVRLFKLRAKDGKKIKKKGRYTVSLPLVEILIIHLYTTSVAKIYHLPYVYVYHLPYV